MRMTPDRLHNLGWGGALAIAFALTLALTFRVNAVKSEVRLADRHIARLTQQNMFLTTELETRANQQQLKELNEVDFGYEAPGARQYLRSERDLAALGAPAGPGAPAPIRVATLGDEPGAGEAMPMVSPLTGRFITSANAAVLPVSGRREAHRPRLIHAALTERLSRLDGARSLARE